MTCDVCGLPSKLNMVATWVWLHSSCERAHGGGNPLPLPEKMSDISGRDGGNTPPGYELRDDFTTTAPCSACREASLPTPALLAPHPNGLRGSQTSEAHPLGKLSIDEAQRSYL